MACGMAVTVKWPLSCYRRTRLVMSKSGLLLCQVSSGKLVAIKRAVISPSFRWLAQADSSFIIIIMIATFFNDLRDVLGL